MKMRLPLVIVELLTRVQKRKVLLRTDPLLRPRMPLAYSGNTPFEFSFSVFDFLDAIGFCRNCSPTKTIKFPLALDFLDLLVRNDANELRILINDDETIEDKQAISKNMGEGLSLLIAEELYGITRRTVKKLDRRGNESKPDFQGFTPHLKIVWEAKGSTDPITQNEINYAKYQKTNEPADFAFASLASLKTDSITQVDVEDPEPLPLEGRELGSQLSRTMHYVNIFNYIGQAKLSRYFELLGKRLLHDKRFPEFPEKEELFEKIKSRSIRISFKDHGFLGNIEKIGENDFLYVGFDEQLLTVQGFLNFRNYEDDFHFRQDNNIFAVTNDGICYGYFQDPHVFQSLGYLERVDVERVPFYRDVLSIWDLDDMFSFQLVEQVKYFFEREGFEVSREVLDSGRRYDFIVGKNGKKYVVEVKKADIIKPFEQLRSSNFDAAFLFTTLNISDEDVSYALESRVIIVDRVILKKLLRKRQSIFNLLQNLPTQ